MFGAVKIDDGKLLTRFTDKYNAMTFLEFLCVVYRRFPDTLIVLDNALYHHAGIVTDCAFLTGLDLLFMPPYSPELNSIERVWKLAKKHATHNRYFQQLNDLRSALEGEFGKFVRRNDELMNLCALT